MAYQMYSSPSMVYQPGLEYDNMMNEVAVQMAASQLSRSRYAYQSTPKRWSGRIEKPRSTHTSPAIQERRRAYSTTRMPSYHHNGLNNYSISRPITTPRAASRPYSWHPSNSYQMYGMSPTSADTSPAASSYLPTPQVSASTPSSMSMQFMSPFQLPLLEPTYNGPSYMEKATTYSPPMVSTATSYAMDTYSTGSPTWHYMYDGQAPILTSTRLPSISPPEQPWYDTNCTQLSQPLLQPSLLPPIHSQPTLSSMIEQEHLAPSAVVTSAPEVEEEEGEVLVGLGLYDRPEESRFMLDTCTISKLAEAWQPPPETTEDDDSSNDEEDAEGETPGTPDGPAQSWFHI